MEQVRHHESITSCADRIVNRIGEDITLGVPLGLGKPVPLVNELYRRAKNNPSIQLEILTALSLARPSPSNELERRLLEPMNQRIFGDYPELDYVRDRQNQALPDNVEVVEFYVRPGSILGNPPAQQSYLSSNFTFIVREMLDRGVNLIGLMISASQTQDGKTVYSLSCNADLSLDLIRCLEDIHDEPSDFMVVGQVNENLPFMYGDAEVEEQLFDAVIEHPSLNHELFGPPHQPVSTADYMIGLHASTLVEDGGTLQLGIGSISDAVTAMLCKRHEDPDTYRELLDRVDLVEGQDELIREIGGADRFDRGLYACTEMLVPGFLYLMDAGILGRPEDEVCIDAGFFLGPSSMYQQLREMSDEQRKKIMMRSVSFVNDLYDQQELKEQQRTDARFINTALKLTVTGAVVSDGLEDHQVLSGVGGQYNFVSMAHALEDGRSIIVLPSTHTKSNGQVESNIVWNYGNLTIPRHLRDVVVTEYGAVDLRSKTDVEVIAEVLKVTDSRFQPELVKQAKKHGKLPRSYSIPEQYQNNTPEKLERQLEPFSNRDLPRFPFGTELTEQEQTLIKALKTLQRRVQNWSRLSFGDFSALGSYFKVPQDHEPYLKRLDLDSPSNLKQTHLRRLVSVALSMAE